MFPSTMASSTFQLGFGYRLQGEEDPIFKNAVQATHYLFTACMLPSKLITPLHTILAV